MSDRIGLPASYDDDISREPDDGNPLEDMRMAADGYLIGIRDCGFFHGPDGECTYSTWAPADYDIRECGSCGARWNYGTPADRCPFEADHEPDDLLLLGEDGGLAWRMTPHTRDVILEALELATGLARAPGNPCDYPASEYEEIAAIVSEVGDLHEREFAEDESGQRCGACSAVSDRDGRFRCPAITAGPKLVRGACVQPGENGIDPHGVSR